MSDQQTYVFNQYYIDFLKKLKGFAKEKKEDSKEARNVLRAIKKHYGTMDKLSSDYITFLHQEGTWVAYEQEPSLEISLELGKKQLYRDITIQDILHVTNNSYLVSHFLVLMYLFTLPELPVDAVLEAIKKLHHATEFEEKLKDIPHENAVKQLKKLQDMHKAQSKTVLDDELKEIENTSLGKLAKEIMGDLNIEELQKTMSDPNANILSSFQDPNSGFGKVLSTVSQKMISKISSGELQQETLLKDAMELATKIPNMLPGGMGSQLGNMGEMLQQFQNLGNMMGGGKKGGSNPMDMLQSMMGMMNANPGARGAASTRVSNAMRKQKTADRLKRKLQKHRENNIQREVEDHHE
jgi:hypothetical protein